MTFIIDELVDLMHGILTALSQAVETLINCIFYPFQVIFTWIGNIAKLIFDTVINFFSSLWGLFDLMYSFLSNNFLSFLPLVWVSIILVGVTIVFLLRLYFFLKDVSIAGFKI